MVKFQSTHLHEVWRWVYMKIIRLRMFQSTHLHEVWPNAVFSMASAYLFQSTHLHEVWPPLFHFTSHVKEFQSTHLHEVWQSWQFSHDLINSFNPHTYMRCDVKGACIFHQRLVSIHTPTWGVTAVLVSAVMSILKFQSTHLHEVWLRDVILHKKGNVSIHTPTWGVTPKVKCTLDLSEVSIHTPTWGVTYSHACFMSSSFVSIHTPTWGVTGIQNFRGSSSKVSIHTPTWGVTTNNNQFGWQYEFQSTHLHEVWHIFMPIPVRLLCFNPHTYMRCDIGGMTQYIEFDVSIHTPTWGVTCIY